MSAGTSPGIFGESPRVLARLDDIAEVAVTDFRVCGVNLDAAHGLCAEAKGQEARKFQIERNFLKRALFGAIIAAHLEKRSNV